jgi:hypothetical protein
MAKGETLPLSGLPANGLPLQLAWHREYLRGMVALTSAYYFVLVPAETPGDLALREFEFITHTGRPAGKIYANPLQLISPRDPDLTACGPLPVQCPRELALLLRLQQRSAAASYVLPKIVPSGAPPAWSRGTISTKDRQTLWRAGGA